MSFESLGRRYARLATDVAVGHPRLWRLVRPLLRLEFERLAPRWDSFRSPESFDAFEAALEQLDRPPARALDLGTGTGIGALAIARRFPEAEVAGADLAEAMIGEARAKLTEDERRRVRFDLADASRLPYGDGSFDLVTLQNMIPFFDELTRVVAPGGTVVIGFSAGAETPIYVPADRLEAELARRAFGRFEHVHRGRAVALLAHKHHPA